MVADRSTLDAYPLVLTTGEEHVDACASALAAFGRTIRLGIEEMDNLKDDDSEGIDRHLARSGQVAVVCGGTPAARDDHR